MIIFSFRKMTLQFVSYFWSNHQISTEVICLTLEHCNAIGIFTFVLHFQKEAHALVVLCVTYFFTVVASYGVNFLPRLCQLQISDATLVPQRHKIASSTRLLIIFEFILILTRLDFNQNKTPFQKVIETHPDMLSFAWLHSLQIISGHLKYLFRTNCD